MKTNAGPSWTIAFLRVFHAPICCPSEWRIPEAMSCHPKSSAGYGVLLTTLSQNKQAAVVAKGRLVQLEWQTPNWLNPLDCGEWKGESSQKYPRFMASISVICDRNCIEICQLMTMGCLPFKSGTNAFFGVFGGRSRHWSPFFGLGNISISSWQIFWTENQHPTCHGNPFTKQIWKIFQMKYVFFVHGFQYRYGIFVTENHFRWFTKKKNMSFLVFWWGYTSKIPGFLRKKFSPLHDPNSRGCLGLPLKCTYGSYGRCEILHQLKTLVYPCLSHNS